MPLWRKSFAWGAILTAVLVFLILFKEVLLPFVVGLAVALALLQIAYERLLTAIHNEHTLENYATMGRRLGRRQPAG